PDTPAHLYPLSYTTLFRSPAAPGLEHPRPARFRLGPLASRLSENGDRRTRWRVLGDLHRTGTAHARGFTSRPGCRLDDDCTPSRDRKSTRLNSSHVKISYA